MLWLAAPLALAELGWMGMGIVDTIMAGPYGPAAVGAGGLAGSLGYPILIGGTGILLGMDTLVSQSFGAKDHRDYRRTLINAVWLALATTPAIVLASLATIPMLYAFGTNPNVMQHFDPYMRALQWGVPPLLLFSAFRRYLQAVDVVKPVTFALVSANLINAAGNWLLMYRYHMGLKGSGYSTSIARLYLCAVLFVAVVRYERQSGNLLWKLPRNPDLSRIRRLISLGMPAAAQLAFEGAIFGVVAVMAAKLDEISLAAHGIAVQVIATAYMVPLGISSAAAVRVGQAIGRRDPGGAAAAGWAALAITAFFMIAAGIAMWSFPSAIVRGFIGNMQVQQAGRVLLRIAAFFVLFDGIQVTATGALRGVGNTRTSMQAHFIGYWLIGIPLSYLLCFRLEWRAAGIWAGLDTGVILIGTALLFAWRRLLPR
jgi:MATE family multidrug resistance protein